VFKNHHRCPSPLLLLLAALALLADARPGGAGIIPADRATVWNPGIPGGIPTDADATRPATVWLPSGNPYAGFSVNPAIGNGTIDATSAINNALNSAASAASASARKIVLLAPGTYRTTGIINLGRSNVTLRGSGPRTIIDHRAAADYAAIAIGHSVDDYSTTPVVNVVGGAAKGAAQITVADASRFNVGDILQIDQLADGSESGPAGWVWKLDSWWSMRSPYADFPGGGGLQGKFPDSPNGYRPIAQRIEVLAKSGNVLTIYDPGTRRGSPLHVAFPAAMDPEVWRAAGGTHDVVRYTGLEDLTVWSAAKEGDAKDMVVMNGAAYSWIKNVETDGSKNTWSGRHIHLQTAVYRAEVRGSYSHHSSNYYQGSNAYGIIYSGSDCLIEDNIVRELNKPVLGETSGGGNVIAYNYADEAVIESLTNSWQETAINMSHASFCHSDLFEGNHTPNLGVDSTHGNNGWGVFFRNWVTGRNGSGRTEAYLRAIFVDGWSREMTSVGNVLGSPSFFVRSTIIDPASGTNPLGNASYYTLGSNAWELGTGRKRGADYMDDGQAARLFHRHLDVYYTSRQPYDNPSNPVKTLPDSLYLTSKPAFFGALPWPWVNPGGAVKVHTLPARDRFEAGVPVPYLRVASISPVAGSTEGGTTVTIRGSQFEAGSTVTVGGVEATEVVVVKPTSLTAVTGARLTGLADVTVTLPAPRSATLPQGFFYVPPPTPTSFYTVVPCRLVDTRAAQTPALGASERRVWTVVNMCDVPATARALAVNVTVAAPTAAGHVRLAPGNGLTESSAINFSPGQTRANNAMVMLATDATGTVAATNRSSSPVHLVLDVSGYFQ
jgi:hypothetical protein